MKTKSIFNKIKADFYRDFILYSLLTTTLVFVSINAHAQQKNEGVSYKDRKNVVMKDQISILKNGALLVRLKTKTNSVNALKEMGDTAGAKLIIEKQNQFNKNIISAFRNNYKFSPVFFFTSDFSDTIRNHKLSEVIFVNDNLNPDPTIKPGVQRFLISEFGNVAQDTASYLSGTYLAQTDEGLKRDESYYGGTDTKIQAFVIMSDQFIQLNDPFPYYSRVRKSNPAQKDLDKAIKKLNENLINFYKESNP